jgi:hypothetical protein
MSTLTQGLLVCDTLEEVRQAAKDCQQWMVDHVAGYAAEYWDQPKQRAEDGKFSIYVDARVLGAVAPHQRERVEVLRSVQVERVGEAEPVDEWQPVAAEG